MYKSLRFGQSTEMLHWNTILARFRLASGSASLDGSIMVPQEKLNIERKSKLEKMLLKKLLPHIISNRKRNKIRGRLCLP